MFHIRRAPFYAVNIGRMNIKTVKAANDYIAHNTGSVNTRYMPRYHACVPIGWGNDPNGLIFYKDRIHMFCQYNPYNPWWDSMHWGHFVSSDFVRWQFLPVALAPDSEYDCGGCFSGTAAEKDGRLYLIYTGVKDYQQQCVAFSDDGITFTKSRSNPVINYRQVPDGCSIYDFRDPKVFRRKKNEYFCIAGTEESGRGNILLYRSDDMLSWKYVGKLFGQDGSADNSLEVNGVCECPDYTTVDGKELLLFSAMNFPERDGKYQNLHSVLYLKGNLDIADGKFVCESYDEIDAGFDFYAAQTMHMPDGRTILIAWKHMWDRTVVTDGDGWAGTYTLPRELYLKNGRLLQKPVREIEVYRNNPVEYSDIPLNRENKKFDGVNGNVVEIEAVFRIGTAERAGLRFFAGKGGQTSLYYDAHSSRVVFDRTFSGMEQKGKEANTSVRSCAAKPDEGKISFRLFLDVSCAEVFINGGRSVMTANVYADPRYDTGIEFFAEGGIASLSVKKYDIIV